MNKYTSDLMSQYNQVDIFLNIVKYYWFTTLCDNTCEFDIIFSYRYEFL